MGVRAAVQYQSSHVTTPLTISTVEDVDAFIDALLAAPPLHDLATVWSLDRPFLPSGVPDHEFLVGARKEHPIGVLFFSDKDGGWVTKGGPDSAGEPRFYYLGGHDTEFRDHSDVPIALVRRAVKEFLLSRGQRPTCVEWQAHYPEVEGSRGAQEQVAPTCSRCCPDMESGGEQHTCWPPF